MGVLNAGGTIYLEEAPCGHMKAVTELAEEMGAVCQQSEGGLYVQAPEKLKQISWIGTDVYPGFPTDLQSVALVTALNAEGSCIIEEKIFENRFHIIEPLKAMGADLEILDSKRVKVSGYSRLKGQCVEARELRGGAALIIAGLVADGVTTVKGVKYIMRGYENICKDLRELGARVVGVREC
jgi:UDP-N-acetylglucosamine 1-carboxyvinyltransferase